MPVLAAVRPDEWNLPLTIHVLGAMVLVGALVLALAALVSTWRGGSPTMSRLGFQALLWVALPSWIVMRVAAQWIYDEEGFVEDPSWVNIGFVTSEPTFLLLIVATALTGVGLRRGRLVAAEGGAQAPARDRVATVLVAVSLLAYLVAIWAMTAKPV